MNAVAGIWNGLDNRKFPRVTHSCKISISKKEGEDIVNAVTENIGVGGICAVLDKSVEVFDTVKILLEINEKEPPIKCDGLIVWAVKRQKGVASSLYEYDAGIEFKNISSIDSARLSKLIEKLIKNC
ncbi:Type IV pilus assembly PilZ domain protein [Candidatus Omnitrophus magneticus]|uniref:Type IV pilus assembly PilZ domain protein n=1 Tax=Candidatus Omnitrophus magneticus TaxID=1609969 RepID=A0A0F0CJK5_9BACT|nr:Type IV pilus assembly PilZ domain protein [Candidatus Omnitrophus magneticus]